MHITFIIDYSKILRFYKMVWEFGPKKFPTWNRKIELSHKNGFLRANLSPGECMYISFFVRSRKYGLTGFRNYVLSTSLLFLKHRLEKMACLSVAWSMSQSRKNNFDGQRYQIFSYTRSRKLFVVFYHQFQ